MKKQSLFPLMLLLQLVFVSCAIGCKKTPATNDNNPSDPPVVTPEPGNPVSTPIPNELVGTWWAADNTKPMSESWDEGSFQGETGFKDFRTMVFTADGKNAVEYTSEVFEQNSGQQKRQMYKITGTLEYSASPLKLVFHAVSGKIRVFRGNTYTESNIIASDIAKYYSVLTDMIATPTQLTAKRNDGANSWSVKYLKIAGTGGSSNQPPQNSPYLNPPAAGTYVQIGQQYFPTVQIGNQEWMSVNYLGNDGITLPNKLHYGTFYRFTDLNKVTVPAGWRIPTKQDYIKLLESQNIAFDATFNSTNGSDLDSKRKLGRLMAVNGWLKQDGYANNASGFNAVPANVQIANVVAPGEGYNCVLWTNERDAYDNYVSFKIIQLPSDTYAAIASYPEGYNPTYAPVRLVRDR